MKKLVVSLLAALCVAAPLFAEDFDEVREVVVKSFKARAKGNLAGALEMITSDYRETDSDGDSFNYRQLMWLASALDGKHPEEFFLVFWSVEKNGRIPSDSEEAEVRRLARTPEGISRYKEMVPRLIAELKGDAAQALRSLKFVCVKVDDDTAVVIVKYDSESKGKLTRKSETFSLRKIGDEWRIYRSVTRNVDK